MVKKIERLEREYGKYTCQSKMGFYYEDRMAYSRQFVEWLVDRIVEAAPETVAAPVMMRLIRFGLKQESCLTIGKVYDVRPCSLIEEFELTDDNGNERSRPVSEFQHPSLPVRVRVDVGADKGKEYNVIEDHDGWWSWMIDKTLQESWPKCNCTVLGGVSENKSAEKAKATGEPNLVNFINEIKNVCDNFLRSLGA